MGELHHVTPNCKFCKSCTYYKHQNDAYGCCDYIGVEGHSRTFGENGKRRLERGTCDKYKPKRSSRNV